MKEPIEKVEEQIYQKRRTVRYDIRDLTVEMINKKYVEYFENDEKSLENINQIYVPDYQRDFTWDNKRLLIYNKSSNKFPTRIPIFSNWNSMEFAHK